MNLLRSLVKSDLRVFGLVFSAIVLVTVIQAVRQPRWYEVIGTLKYHRAMMLAVSEPGPPVEDWNELRVALKSSELIHRVIGRLSEAERTGLIAPYAGPSKQVEIVNVERLIGENQRTSYDRLQGELTIAYRHPDRLLVAQMVNLMLDEGIAYQVRKRIDEAMREVEELKSRAEAQERHVKELTEEMTAFRERSETHTGKSFETGADYVTMQQQLEKEQKMLKTVIQRMRDTTMGFGMDTASWRLSKRAVPPKEDDYLIAPIVVRLSWGFAVAVVGGLLAVGVVNVFTRGRELADNQKEAA
ncbi:MAG TPA: hypothetical protein VK985_11665 [Rariglobus sp.]|nr:hypothetical protein [Rariglobus sp.]